MNMRSVIICICVTHLILAQFSQRFDTKSTILFTQNNSEKPMMKTWNLALRGALEIAAISSMSYWGYDHWNNSYMAGVLVPATAMALWGIFAVEGDPSRSGKTVIQTPGWARLTLEIAFFSFATYTLIDIGYKNAGLGYGAVTVFHYALSLDRIKWLLKQ